MQHVPLGPSGLTVSRLCLGTMQFGWTADETASASVLDAYLEAGGTFLDSADIYSRFVKGHEGGESEKIIGRWLASRGVRDQVVIATKVRGRMWEGADGEGLSRAHIVRACEDSLRRLQVDCIDLYQCHWFDDATPIEETLRAFEELIRAGKVRAIGASNYPPPRLRAALEAAASLGLPRFVSLQPHYNLVHRGEFERGLAEVCREHGLAVIPYSPLAAGFLTGKYRQEGRQPASARRNRASQYFTPEGWAVVEALADIAEARHVPPAAVAIAWLLSRPGVTVPIVGANSPAQLAEQLAAIDLELSVEELGRLDWVSELFARR